MTITPQEVAKHISTLNALIDSDSKSNPVNSELRRFRNNPQFIEGVLMYVFSEFSGKYDLNPSDVYQAEYIIRCITLEKTCFCLEGPPEESSLVYRAMGVLTEGFHSHELDYSRNLSRFGFVKSVFKHEFSDWRKSYECCDGDPIDWKYQLEIKNAEKVISQHIVDINLSTTLMTTLEEVKKGSTNMTAVEFSHWYNYIEGKK